MTTGHDLAEALAADATDAAAITAHARRMGDSLGDRAA
jgi:hypothetical protein